MRLQLDEIPSPLGTILLVAGDDGVVALDFDDCRERMQTLLKARFGEVELVRADDPCGYSSRLRAYLTGTLDALDDVAVAAGGTPFQDRVWRALRSIPAGATRSYGEIARAIGRPTAARAVGAANGRNPVALVVPCHRVVGSDGALTGYAGGVERKRWLLAHEGLRV